MITNDLEVSVAARRATAPPEAADGPPAVSVRGLRKSYDGVTQALDGVDLDVRRGEVLAILGPNGAGKTTLVEILEGHRTADAGEVRVLGYDPAKRERAFRARIGIVLQEEGIDQTLSVREVVELYSAAYPHPRPAMEVLDLVGLGDRPGVRVSALSGGQRRRLDLALGIAGDPELVFLDEPTTGFDPEARREFWQLIRDLQAGGTTIVLTTHYLEEAEALADRVGVIAKGRLIAVDTPRSLGRRDSALATVSWRTPGGGWERTRSATPTAVVADLAARFSGEVPGLTVTRPTLEDIYLEMIGGVA